MGLEKEGLKMEMRRREVAKLINLKEYRKGTSKFEIIYKTPLAQLDDKCFLIYIDDNGDLCFAYGDYNFKSKRYFCDEIINVGRENALIVPLIRMFKKIFKWNIKFYKKHP